MALLRGQIHANSTKYPLFGRCLAKKAYGLNLIDTPTRSDLDRIHFRDHPNYPRSHSETSSGKVAPQIVTPVLIMCSVSARSLIKAPAPPESEHPYRLLKSSVGANSDDVPIVERTNGNTSSPSLRHSKVDSSHRRSGEYLNPSIPDLLFSGFNPPSSLPFARLFLCTVRLEYEYSSQYRDTRDSDCGRDSNYGCVDSNQWSYASSLSKSNPRSTPRQRVYAFQKGNRSDSSRANPSQTRGFRRYRESQVSTTSRHVEIYLPSLAVAI